MTFSIDTARRASLAFLGAALLFALPARAQVVHQYWTTNSSTIQNETRIYVNFATSPVIGKTFDVILPNPDGGNALKHFTYNVFATSGSPASCYEVFTRAVTGSSDSRIFAQSGTTTWRSVSNDQSSTNKHALARVWLAPGYGVMLRVAAAHSSFNNMDMTVHLHKRTESSAASCELAGKPFLSNTTGWPSFKNTN